MAPHFPPLCLVDLLHDLYVQSPFSEDFCQQSIVYMQCTHVQRRYHTDATDLIE